MKWITAIAKSKKKTHTVLVKVQIAVGRLMRKHVNKSE